MTPQPHRLGTSFLPAHATDDPNVPVDEEVMDRALELVEKHRNLDCMSYDRCLNHAAVQGWPSFSCTRCPHRSGELSQVEPLLKDEKRSPL